VARFVLTPAVATATDVQMLHIMKKWPDDVVDAIKQKYAALRTVMKAKIEATGNLESPFYHIATAAIAPVCVYMPTVVPPGGETVYRCSWTNRELAPGESVWLCASYAAGKANTIRLFYIGQNPEQPGSDMNIHKLRAMRTCHRWQMLFTRSLMEWQIDARFTDSCSADMRMARFLGEGLKAIDCCASTLADYFAARHIVFHHLD
jgi:hypothetical protein